jgi:hypothetical protein
MLMGLGLVISIRSQRDVCPVCLESHVKLVKLKATLTPRFAIFMN